MSCGSWTNAKPDSCFTYSIDTDEISDVETRTRSRQPEFCKQQNPIKKFLKLMKINVPCERFHFVSTLPIFVCF